MKVYSLTKTLDDYVDFYINDPSEAEVIVVGGSSIDLEKFPKLKYIFKCGVGVDNIPDLKDTGVKLIMPSELTKIKIYDEVSSFAVFLILQSHYRKLGNVSKWEKEERKTLSDKSCLTVGSMGNIGRFVFDKLEDLFKDNVGFDVNSFFHTTLEKEMKSADIVTLHCPLTDGNRGMIKTEWLKDDVILVNTARAELVDENELYEFLKSNPKATAAFDVFWEEPYKGKLLELDNFIATPHVASMGDGFRKGLYRDLMELLK